MRRIGLALAAAASLAGCKEDQKPPQPAGAAPTAAARTAVLQSIAGQPNMPRTVQFRGVQAYPQAAPNRTAVCGLVSAFADDTTIFVPFVSVATRAGDPAATPPRFDIDSRIGTSTADASRVYAALVANCWEGGGPAPGRPLSLAPLPDAVPDPRTPAAADPPKPAAAAAVVAPPAGAPATAGAPSGTVTLRQSANVHSDPHGPTVRTVGGGTALRVFGTAPGGWYQVGDTAPFGWVHESMLNR